MWHLLSFGNNTRFGFGATQSHDMEKKKLNFQTKIQKNIYKVNKKRRLLFLQCRTESLVPDRRITWHGSWKKNPKCIQVLLKYLCKVDFLHLRSQNRRTRRQFKYEFSSHDMTFGKSAQQYWRKEYFCVSQPAIYRPSPTIRPPIGSETFHREVDLQWDGRRPVWVCTSQPDLSWWGPRWWWGRRAPRCLRWWCPEGHRSASAPPCRWCCRTLPVHLQRSSKVRSEVVSHSYRFVWCRQKGVQSISTTKRHRGGLKVTKSKSFLWC